MNIRGVRTMLTVCVAAVTIAVVGCSGDNDPAPTPSTPPTVTIVPEKGAINNTARTSERLICTTNIRSIQMDLGRTFTIDGVQTAVTVTADKVTVVSTGALKGAQSVVVNENTGANLPATIRQSATNTALLVKDWGKITSVKFCDTGGQ